MIAVLKSYVPAILRFLILKKQWNSFRDTGTTIGQGRAVKELWAMETFEKQNNRYQLCLCQVINNVDLKYNNKNHRKLSEFSGSANAKKMFQVDLDKP